VVTHLLRALEVVVVVAASRVVLGVWPTSIVLAAMGLCCGLRTWHRIETRSRRSGPMPERPMVAPPPGHVAFARALARVADAYLTACEAEDHPDGCR
jgi:hypothetical protein